MSNFLKIKLFLASILLVFTAACAGMQTNTTIEGTRVQGEIVRSAGGLYGDDVTTGVVDYADRNGNWRSQDFLVTSTSFAKMLSTALIPGVAIGAIQSDIARYQVDHQCDSQCGAVTNVLAQSNSQTLTQVEVDAIAQIMNGGTGGW